LTSARSSNNGSSWLEVIGRPALCCNPKTGRKIVGTATLLKQRMTYILGRTADG